MLAGQLAPAGAAEGRQRCAAVKVDIAAAGAAVKIKSQASRRILAGGLAPAEAAEGRHPWAALGVHTATAGQQQGQQEEAAHVCWLIGWHLQLALQSAVCSSGRCESSSRAVAEPAEQKQEVAPHVWWQLGWHLQWLQGSVSRVQQWPL
jgi:hypothetical protein